MNGDKDAAKQTQDEFTRTAPIVSQIRSVIEISKGKKDEAKKTQQIYLNNIKGKYNFDDNKNEEKQSELITPNTSNNSNNNNNKRNGFLSFLPFKKKNGNLKQNNSNNIVNENTNNNENDNNNETDNKNDIGIPFEFICPISMDIMNDPVICSDGHTYDRESIEDWFDDNDTSPKTNISLDNKNLIPNIALKSMIHSWKRKHNYNENIHNFIEQDL